MSSSRQHVTSRSATSLLSENHFNQMEVSKISFPIEGRRKCRPTFAADCGSNDVRKRASLHEHLLNDCGDNQCNRKLLPLLMKGKQSQVSHSTLEIPNSLRTERHMSHSFGSQPNPSDFIRSANQNFILHKSKSVMYDEHNTLGQRYKKSVQTEPIVEKLRNHTFTSVDEGVDDTCSDDDEHNDHDHDPPRLNTFPLLVDERFPSYNPFPHLKSSNSSSSWLGGMFAPKFTTISAHTAAKSASLSFQQMKSFSGYKLYSDRTSLYDLEATSGFGKFQRKRENHSQADSLMHDRSRTFENSEIGEVYDTKSNPKSISKPCSFQPASSSTAAADPSYSFRNADAIIPKLHVSNANEPSSCQSSSILLSMKSHSNLAYSSSSGCSTQSSASSTNSLSQQFSRSNKSRSSLREAAQNFRDFIQHYELGLIECISSVEEKQQINDELDVAASKSRMHDVDALETPNMTDVHAESSFLSSNSLTNQQSLPCTSSTAIFEIFNRDTLPKHSEPKNGDVASRYSLDKSEVDPKSPPSNSPLLSQSLRLQLAKVRSLRDQYETGYRCSEALEKMMKLTKKTQACDREFRANEMLMAKIEAQLEEMMGTFRIKVEDLEGFARICPRDNYEIEFRHGKQRQDLRVRIGKSLERNWEGNIQEIEFRGALKPTIICRLREIKSRWNVAWSRKNITLGVTSISMRELLVAVSKGRQILLDANVSGSLKLRITCSWQPKLIEDEISLASTVSPKPSISQSFLSENLRLSQCDTTTGRKASTITVPPSIMHPASSQSYSRAECVTPVAANSNFVLKRSSNHSRSLLTLPSFYYSFENDNHLSTSLQKSKDLNFQKAFNSGFALNQTTLSVEFASSSNSNYSSSSSLTDNDISLLSSPTSIKSQTVKHKNISSLTTSRIQSKISQLNEQLNNLQLALEDYRGQYIELTMMSITVGKLIILYENIDLDSKQSLLDDASSEVPSSTSEPLPINTDSSSRINYSKPFNCLDDEGKEEENSTTSDDEIENALAEFDFLEVASQSSEDRKLEKSTFFTEKHVELHHRQKVNPLGYSLELLNDKNSSKFQMLDLWSSVLLLHLNSSLDQLNQVGSWILKGLENQALTRLRADAFAFELIHDILVCDDKRDPLGKDCRVIELWNFASDRLIKSERASFYCPYIMSWRQLCKVLFDLMIEYGMLSDSNNSDDSIDEDTLRYSTEWLANLMIPQNQTKLTIFDLRIFFELDLWKSSLCSVSNAFRRNSLQSSSSATEFPHHKTLSIKRLFQIALDVDRLMRKSKKISLHSIESILFDRFNVNCIWIPADVTLTMVNLLYENHSHEKQSKLTTSEVKKLDRCREIGKLATNWIIWLLQEGRFEIREHVLTGLEMKSAFLRRASCFGIMYIFKLMKRGNQYGQRQIDRSTSSAVTPNFHRNSVTFFGHELDSLLYVSMEDQDGKVREEARKALKCLGHFGQQRLNQMERSRMGFFGGSDDRRGMNVSQNAKILGRSMPNLNKI